MVGKLFAKVFGTYNERELKALNPIVEKIEALEDEYRTQTDEALKAKTALTRRFARHFLPPL